MQHRIAGNPGDSRQEQQGVPAIAGHLPEAIDGWPDILVSHGDLTGLEGMGTRDVVARDSHAAFFQGRRSFIPRSASSRATCAPRWAAATAAQFGFVLNR